MVTRVAIIFAYACGIGFLPSQAHASCENPSYADRYGAIDRAAMAHGGVNSCKPPNTQRPLFTRAGTLACATIVGYKQSYEVRNHDWVLIPLAGVTYQGDRKNLAADGRATPQFFGCAVNADGITVTLMGDLDKGAVRTNLGWLSMDDLRNSADDANSDAAATKIAQRAAVRPTLCKATGECVYTDVSPYEPVPRLGVDPRFYRSSMETEKGHELEVSSTQLQNTQIQNLQYSCTYEGGTVKTLGYPCPNQDIPIAGKKTSFFQKPVPPSQLLSSATIGDRVCTYDYYAPRDLSDPSAGGTVPSNIYLRMAKDCPQQINFVIDKTGAITKLTPHMNTLVPQSSGTKCTYHVPDLDIDIQVGSSVGRQCPNSVPFGSVPKGRHDGT